MILFSIYEITSFVLLFSGFLRRCCKRLRCHITPHFIHSAHMNLIFSKQTSVHSHNRFLSILHGLQTVLSSQYPLKHSSLFTLPSSLSRFHLHDPSVAIRTSCSFPCWQNFISQVPGTNLMVNSVIPSSGFNPAWEFWISVSKPIRPSDTK